MPGWGDWLSECVGHFRHRVTGITGVSYRVPQLVLASFVIVGTLHRKTSVQPNQSLLAECISDRSANEIAFLFVYDAHLLYTNGRFSPAICLYHLLARSLGLLSCKRYPENICRVSTARRVCTVRTMPWQDVCQSVCHTPVFCLNG